MINWMFATQNYDDRTFVSEIEGITYQACVSKIKDSYSIVITSIWLNGKESAYLSIKEEDSCWETAANRGVERIKQLMLGLSNSNQTITVLQLQEAVRIHMCQKGNDRCWMDDINLYDTVLPEGSTQVDLKLPLKPEFLTNCREYCEKYWEHRQPK